MLGMLAASGGRSPVFAQTSFDENEEEYGYTEVYESWGRKLHLLEI